eukprot:m51a1_g9721 hypothetical protein (2366) ;mRNA; r:1452232-1471747
MTCRCGKQLECLSHQELVARDPRYRMGGYNCDVCGGHSSCMAGSSAWPLRHCFACGCDVCPACASSGAVQTWLDNARTGTASVLCSLVPFPSFVVAPVGPDESSWWGHCLKCVLFCASPVYHPIAIPVGLPISPASAAAVNRASELAATVAETLLPLWLRDGCSPPCAHCGTRSSNARGFVLHCSQCAFSSCVACFAARPHSDHARGHLCFLPKTITTIVVSRGTSMALMAMDPVEAVLDFSEEDGDDATTTGHETDESCDSDTAGENVRSLPTDRNWIKELQEIMALPHDTKQEQLAKEMRLFCLLLEFEHVAKTVGSTIISEVHLPHSRKTVCQNTKMGGVAGGQKFLTHGIFFKFSIDHRNMYGGDEFAGKATAHELHGCEAFFDFIASSRSPNAHKLNLPMMAIIDFRGFRVAAISQLPLSADSLVYGSGDGGQTVRKSIGELNGVMEEAAKFLNLKPHVVGRSASEVIAGPCDIEGHLGKDGKYYVVDTARVFPPESVSKYFTAIEIPELRDDFSSVADAVRENRISEGAYNAVAAALVGHSVFGTAVLVPTGHVGKHLYYLLRAELVKAYQFPLSSDAFTAFGRHDAERNNRERYLALVLNILQSAALNNNDTDPICDMVYAEIVTRSLKSVVRAAMRNVVPAAGDTAEMLDMKIRQAILQHFNLLLRLDPQADVYWEVVVKLGMQRKYGHYVSLDDPENWGRYLSRSREPEAQLLLFKALQRQLGVVFSPAVDIRGVGSQCEARPLRVEDILKVEVLIQGRLDVLQRVTSAWQPLGMTPGNFLAVVQARLRIVERDVYSCGSNLVGQLGHGDRADRYEPRIVMSLEGEECSQVAVSEFNSFALTRKGVVYSWGSFGFCLGYQPQLQQVNALPHPVDTLRGTRVVQIVAGSDQVVALSDMGHVFVWGDSLAAGESSPARSAVPVWDTMWNDMSQQVVFKARLLSPLRAVQMWGSKEAVLLKTATGRVLYCGSECAVPSEIVHVPGMRTTMAKLINGKTAIFCCHTLRGTSETPMPRPALQSIAQRCSIALRPEVVCGETVEVTVVARPSQWLVGNERLFVVPSHHAPEQRIAAPELSDKVFKVTQHPVIVMHQPGVFRVCLYRPLQIPIESYQNPPDASYLELTCYSNLVTVSAGPIADLTPSHFGRPEIPAEPPRESQKHCGQATAHAAMAHRLPGDWAEFFHWAVIPEEAAGRYEEALVHNDVGVDMLFDIDRDTLKDLGFLKGHAIKFFKCRDAHMRRAQGAGALPRARESLGAAWELRQSVVGRVAEAADLCSLALALPSALCAPCFRRLPLFCAPVPCALSLCRAPHSPPVALAVFLAGWATPEALRQLARRCPGLGRALALPGDPGPCGPCGLCGLCCAMAAVCRSPCGHPGSLALLASLPGLPAEALAAASAEALGAAGSAGGARAALLLRELSRPPLSAHQRGWHPLLGALRAACRSGSAETLRVLRTGPFGAVLRERADEVRSTSPMSRATQLGYLYDLAERVLSEACSSGSAGAEAVLEELACPLYAECLCLGNIMAKEGVINCFCRRCACDDVGVLRRLSRPPFFLGHLEEPDMSLSMPNRPLVALREAFTSVPFSISVPIDKEDLHLQFAYACKSRSAWPLRRLGLPPYCLGHTEATAYSCDSLRTACQEGSSETLDALAEPPYSLTHGDALCCSRVLHTACAWGNAAAVRRLAQPPYCLGREEACKYNCEALRDACQKGCVDVVEELARAPYSLGRTEARAAAALKTACRSGSDDIVHRLPVPILQHPISDSLVTLKCIWGPVSALADLAAVAKGLREVSFAELMSATQLQEVLRHLGQATSVALAVNRGDEAVALPDVMAWMRSHDKWIFRLGEEPLSYDTAVMCERMGIRVVRSGDSFMLLKGSDSSCAADLRDEVRASMGIFGPAVLSNYSTLGITLVNLAFVGRLGAVPMAACALSSTLYNVVGLSGAFGISCALDTLCSQAHGARNPLGASHALQRALVLIAAFTAPVAALLCCEVARASARFLRVLAPGLLPAFWAEGLRRALYAAGVSWPQLVVSAAGVALVAALDWLLIHVLGLGLAGSAAALAGTWALQLALLVLLVRTGGLHSLVLAGGLSGAALRHGWRETLVLAGSGYAMTCSEWWAFEACAFLSGLAGPVSLASFAVVMSLLQLVWTLPMSLGIASSARVGFHLGANDPLRARLVAWSCVVAVLAMEFVYVPAVVFAGRYYVVLFTDDAAVLAAGSALVPYGALESAQDGLNAVLAGVLRGAGLQAYGAAATLLCYYALCLPASCLLLFVARVGTRALFIGMGGGITVLLALFLARVVALKWESVAAEAHARQRQSCGDGTANERTPLNGDPAAEAERDESAEPDGHSARTSA